MKGLVASLMCLAVCFTSMSVKSFNATIHKGGYFGDSIGQESFAPVIIHTAAEMNDYIQKIMKEYSKDDGYDEEGLSGLEGQVRDFFKKYNDKFFKNNNLVIALVDRGSGSVKYDVIDFTVDSKGAGVVHIERKAPIIQTMDYIHWVLMLETGLDVKSVEVVLTDACITRP